LRCSWLQSRRRRSTLPLSRPLGKWRAMRERFARYRFSSRSGRA
jgi:hypothetical protein